MENTRKLLDEAKAKSGIQSDYALAKILGIPKQRVCDYYKARRAPDQYACMKLSEVTGRPLAEVIAAVEIDAEKDEERREAWKRYYKRLGGMAASFMPFVLMALVGVTFFVTSPSSALANHVLASADFTPYKLCAYRVI